MKLTDESKFFIGILAVTLVLLGGAMWLLSKPEKPVILPKDTLITSSTHTIGNPNAKTYLVEFSDFECPACGAFEPAVEKLLTTYPDTLLFAYRHFPLSQHPQGKPAAIAAEAAALQGKFWEMHHVLFANQSSLSDALYGDLAKQVGLNLEVFQKDRKESSVSASIDADTASGNTIGINATPTFFLNGTKLVLNQPEDLTRAVETSLSSK